MKEVENTPDIRKPISSFSMSYYGGVGLVFGFAVCLVFVFIYSMNNRLLQSKSDVEKITNMQCLTQLPKIKVRSGQDIKAAKGYEMIQQAIRTQSMTQITIKLQNMLVKRLEIVYNNSINNL